MQIILSRRDCLTFTRAGTARRRAGSGLQGDVRERWWHVVVPLRKLLAEEANHISIILLVLAKSGSSHLDFNWPIFLEVSWNLLEVGDL